MIHMTASIRTADGTWSVVCRCPWTSTGHATQSQARAAGDAHLREANGS